MRVGVVPTAEGREAADTWLQQTFVGRYVTGVRHVLLESDPVGGYEHRGVFEVHGLELDLDGAETVSLTWLVPGFVEGVLVADEPLVPGVFPAGHPRQYFDATARWRAAGPGLIEQIDRAWMRGSDDPRGRYVGHGLWHLELLGRNARARIDLGEVAPDGSRLAPGSTSLLVHLRAR